MTRTTQSELIYDFFVRCIGDWESHRVINIDNKLRREKRLYSVIQDEMDYSLFRIVMADGKVFEFGLMNDNEIKRYNSVTGVHEGKTYGEYMNGTLYTTGIFNDTQSEEQLSFLDDDTRTRIVKITNTKTGKMLGNAVYLEQRVKHQELF